VASGPPYSFPAAQQATGPCRWQSVFRRISGGKGHIDAETGSDRAAGAPGFTVPFRDLRADSERIVETESTSCSNSERRRRRRCPVGRLDVVEAGFFPRPHGHFVVGRWALSDASFVPFVVAPVEQANPASPWMPCLHRIADVHNLFSAPRWRTFIVTSRLYYQTCVFPVQPDAQGDRWGPPLFDDSASITSAKVAILNEVIEPAAANRATSFPNARPATRARVALGFHVRRLLLPPEG